MRREHGTDSILPSGYTQLDWIESTGTQRIDTEYYPNLATEIDIDMILRGYHGSGSIGTMHSDSYDWRIIFHNTSTSDGIKFDIGGRLGCKFMPLNERKRLVAGNDYTNGHHIELYNEDGTLYAQSHTSRKTTNIEHYTMCFFSIYANSKWQYSKLRVYSMLIWENDPSNLIRHYVPCMRDNDSEIGMYDLCGNICSLTGTPFFINVGSGDFLYG